MPNTTHTYEEFETLLASIYLTTLRLKAVKHTVKFFDRIERILNGFAERHNVQFPKDVFTQPRICIQNEWEILGGNPRSAANWEMLSANTLAFQYSYSIGTIAGTIDHEELGKLDIAISLVSDTYRDILFGE